MRIFRIVDTSELSAYDVILGMDGVEGQWCLFDSPMTVTAIGYTGGMIYGVRDSKPYDVMVTAGVTKFLLLVDHG